MCQPERPALKVAVASGLPACAACAHTVVRACTPHLHGGGLQREKDRLDITGAPAFVKSSGTCELASFHG